MFFKLPTDPLAMFSPDTVHFCREIAVYRECWTVCESMTWTSIPQPIPGVPIWGSGDQVVCYFAWYDGTTQDSLYR